MLSKFSTFFWNGKISLVWNQSDRETIDRPAVDQILLTCQGWGWRVGWGTFLSATPPPPYILLPSLPHSPTFDSRLYVSIKHISMGGRVYIYKCKEAKQTEAAAPGSLCTCQHEPHRKSNGGKERKSIGPTFFFFFYSGIIGKSFFFHQIQIAKCSKMFDSPEKK